MTTTVNQKVANPYFTESSNTFATDITVNGLTVGRGDGNIASNTAFGVDALGSPYILSTNINNVGIGYNALNTIGVGVNTLTLINGGSGYYDNGGETSYFEFTATLTYVSETASLGTYPTATITVQNGVVTGVSGSGGYGFLDTTTVMTAANPNGPGSGLLIGIGSLKSATNNTALGVNAGSTNNTGSNSVYLGYGATGTGSNQIAIGYNVVNLQDNSIILGNSNIIDTQIYGALSNQGTINFVGDTYSNVYLGTSINSGNVEIATGLQDGIINLGSNIISAAGQFNIYNNDAPLNIGSEAGTGTISLGYSYRGQTVDIATGANGEGNKIVNICTGTTSGGSSAYTIGQGNNTNGNIRGNSLTIDAQTLTATGALQLTGKSNVNQNIATTQTTGTLTIGGTGATGNITLGQSTAAQTVNIATGVNNLNAKTVNIGTGGTGLGGTTVNIASNTGVKTVNIGTNNSAGSTAAINIGSTAGVSSITTVNGLLKQQTYLVATLPAGTVGSRSFVTNHRSATSYPIFGEAVNDTGTFGPFNVPVFHDGASWKVG
jgi:hypothetical protein